MTTTRELQRAYPHCFIAVAYTELLLCQADDDGLSCWDILMQEKPPLNPAQVVEAIQAAMEGETAARAEEALKQTKHPSYLTYIAGRMGAV